MCGAFLFEAVTQKLRRMRRLPERSARFSHHLRTVAAGT